MSGTLALWYLMTHNSTLTTVVPAARIREGELAVGPGTALPAIDITRVDRNPRNTLAMSETKRLHTERVQVMVYAKRPEANPSGLGKKGVDAILALVLKACPHQTARIAGVDVRAILPDQAGPDLSDVEMGYAAAAQDFMVIWRETPKLDLESGGFLGLESGGVVTLQE